ncbi:hypothetical protein TNCV_3438271 [Trichonephila clavipes]|nr:hypothetical protein TNCV_3438271 [Trichonephila clavipes]
MDNGMERHCVYWQIMPLTAESCWPASSLQTPCRRGSLVHVVDVIFVESWIKTLVLQKFRLVERFKQFKYVGDQRLRVGLEWKFGESVPSQVSFSSLDCQSEPQDSEEDITLYERDCEESEESADVNDNIPVNPDIYVARDGTEWIPHTSNDSVRFANRNVLRQS